MSSDSKPKTPKSMYEHVMLAAKEARRLNEKYTRRGLTPPKKVTTEAIDRVGGGEVEYEYDAEKPKTNAEDEEPDSPWVQ
jgi:hypothetical protein